MSPIEAFMSADFDSVAQVVITSGVMLGMVYALATGLMRAFAAMERSRLQAYRESQCEHDTSTYKVELTRANGTKTLVETTIYCDKCMMSKNIYKNSNP